MEKARITHRTGDYYGDGTNNLIWEITDADGIAAELYVSTSHHEIMNVWTRDDRQREGLASALYNAATGQYEIFHAPAAHRTPEGNAFARAVGGPAAEYACDCAACLYESDNEG